MANTILCPYCGGTLRTNEAKCPRCGAPNELYTLPPEARIEPKTIEELREFCSAKKLPLDELRFFIGENYKQPRAYGIFREGDQFVVYKNKDDGSRAVRYRGPDEAFAVRELYLRLIYLCRERGL